MKTIRIRRELESDTLHLHLPELQEMIGKTVEIIVREEPVSSPATEEDWEEFFEKAGTDLTDPDVYREYREYDRQHNRPPQL